MDAQYFIYTRGYLAENDYKLMFSPSEDFCPNEIRQFFRQQVRGAINVETYEGTLMTPRWLFSRYHGMVLWGMAVMNSIIGDNNTDDYTGRGVRGFFGMVIKDGSFQDLPFGMEYFKKVYDSLVAPRWMFGKEDFRQNGIPVDNDFGAEVITPHETSSICINTNPKRTVIWGNGHSEIEYLEAAAASRGDTSFITGLSDVAHAYDQNYHYLNALVQGVIVNEDKSFVPPIIVEPKDRDVIKIETQDASKKAFCPKTTLMRVIGLVVMLVIVGMCIRGGKKSKHSMSSGEKTKVEHSESTRNPATKAEQRPTE